jgi:hypothetical protein
MKKLSLALLLGLVGTSAIAGPFGWVVSAYDLTATSYTYCRMDGSTSTPVCGTTINDGWHKMLSGSRAVAAVVEWTTKNATSLEYTLECRSYNSSTYALTVESNALSAVGSKAIVLTNEAAAFDQCRLGLKLTTDTGANAVSAYFATNQ